MAPTHEPGPVRNSDGRLERLSPGQETLLKQHRSAWEAAVLSTASADRENTEHGIALAYRAAGLEPPRQIVWCDSPMQLAHAWQDARLDASSGPNVRDVVVDQLVEQIERGIRSMLAPTAQQRYFDTQPSDAMTVGAAVLEIVTQEIARSGPLLRTRLLSMLISALRSRHPHSRWASLRRAGVSVFELVSIWQLNFLHEALREEACARPLDAQVEAARGLSLVVANAGWLLPHRDRCWLCERPSALSYDARGRLHGAKGPALAYRDGWSYYAWKGIALPAALIEHPEKITIGTIDREDDGILKRCMIEIMTPARFIALGGATRVAHDETGTLWRRIWATGDTWAAVEVVNGTAEPDGTRQHYYLQVPAEMRTARAAVAWTYGIPEHRYALLAERT